MKLLETAEAKEIEVPIAGMDCADCTQHVQKAIAALTGVESVTVLLGSEKALIQLDPAQVDLAAIRKAVEEAGYSVPAAAAGQEPEVRSLAGFHRRVLTLLGLVFGAVLFVTVIGEWLGLFGAITTRLPWPIGVAVVLAAGYPVFRNVLRAAARGQVTSHTLMTLGALAALLVGEWATTPSGSRPNAPAGPSRIWPRWLRRPRAS